MPYTRYFQNVLISEVTKPLRGTARARILLKRSNLSSLPLLASWCHAAFLSELSHWSGETGTYTSSIAYKKHLLTNFTKRKSERILKIDYSDV